MEGLIVLAVLALLLVPILLVVALVMIAGLRRRVGALEARLAQAGLHAAPGPAARQDRHGLAATGPAEAPAPERQPVVLPVATARTPVATDPGPAPLRPPPLPAGPGPLQRWLAAGKRWFTDGNVPVKIGMLVLLAGVAALLKYASDQGWLSAPIELRLAGVALAALAALGFGWRQRRLRQAFALALQGGAIGVLLLVVFAASKRYDLLPLSAAFALSVALVAGMGVLAVAQDSRTLAVLGILAGFMAPLWLSDGSGNHVALFGYYAMLNAAILAIAWWRPWRALNLLGFAFTFGIGSAWGVLQYRPGQFASTEPFLLAFFAFYLLIPILYARRQPATRRDPIDGSLVFGTPLLAFSLQAALLYPDRMALALCALALAALYALLAWALRRQARYAVLAQAHAVLAVGFATLAVPLALSARATGSVFALEGAGLVWLGLRQQRRLPRWAGAALQCAAAVAFAFGVDAWAGDTRALANPTCMGALLLAVAGLASAQAWYRAGRRAWANGFYLWGLAWWLGGAGHEIARFVLADDRADAWLLLVAATGWLAAEAHRWQPARALRMTSLAAILAGLPLAAWQQQAHALPFAGWGALAWALFALLGTRVLVCLRVAGGRASLAAQFAGWLLGAGVLSLAARWLAGWAGLAEGWRHALVGLPWAVLAALSLRRWSWLRQPLGARFDPLRGPLQATLIALLMLHWARGLGLAGSARPLPWVPVLNPLELLQVAVGLLVAAWAGSPQAPAALSRWRLPGLALVAFATLTSIVLHAVHYWGQVPWDGGLWASTLAQTALTVLWSVLGVLAWVAGSRRGQRLLWRVGAVLMAVVLAKLVLIDRQHLGNLLGIASFIAYGLLCTIVGYLAPAPPRATRAATEESA